MMSRTISPKQFLGDTSIGAEARAGRVRALQLYAQANDYPTIEALTEALKAGKAEVVDTSLAFINSLRAKELLPTTVAQYRSILGIFFELVLGSVEFDRKIWDQLVPPGDYYVTVPKRAPTKGELEHILRHLTTPQHRTLIGLLLTGARLNECLSRRVSEIERRPDGHGVIILNAKNTKARYERWLFLTKEILGWIDTYHQTVKSDWILPGELGNHLKDGTAWGIIKDLFEREGLRDSEKGIYSPHSFRTFTQSYMRRAGLNEGVIDAIIGHKSNLGAKKHYTDWLENEAEWVEKCGSITWLTSIEVITRTDPKLVEEVDKLKDFNRKLIAALLGESSAKIEGQELTLEQRIERAKLLLEDKSTETKAGA
jgi:integrase